MHFSTFGNYTNIHTLDQFSPNTGNLMQYREVNNLCTKGSELSLLLEQQQLQIPEINNGHML